MINLQDEPEIFKWHKEKPQLLQGHCYVEVAHEAIGIASRCWTEKNGQGVFDTDMALRLANELCAYMRIISAVPNNMDYLEWKYEQKNKKS